MYVMLIISSDVFGLVC